MRKTWGTIFYERRRLYYLMGRGLKPHRTEVWGLLPRPIRYGRTRAVHFFRGTRMEEPVSHRTHTFLYRMDAVISKRKVFKMTLGDTVKRYYRDIR